MIRITIDLPHSPDAEANLGRIVTSALTCGARAQVWSDLEPAGPSVAAAVPAAHTSGEHNAIDGERDPLPRRRGSAA